MAVATTDCYRRNIASLKAFQPAVAAVIAAAKIPEGVTSAIGRDESRTFLLPAPPPGSENKTDTFSDRSTAQTPRRAWFGGSSMPTISAAEIFAGYGGDGSGVILPGVFTGVEPLVVADRTPPPAAVFVIEPDPLQLKLAFHLYNYADRIESGRLVFLPADGERLVDALRSFFRDHPGYELPVHLLPAAQHSPAKTADWQSAIEEAGRAVTADQTQRMDTLARTLGVRSFGPLPAPPRIAVLSVDSRPPSLEHARRIARALAGLGWSYNVCIPDRPGACHAVARLQAVNELDAEAVLFVNGGAESMRPWLPDDLPIASWYLPGAVVPTRLNRPGAHETAFVATSELQDELAAAGFPSEAIVRCEVAADDSSFHPETPVEETTGRTAADVGIFMDLPDDRPESCDIHLTSHLALWRALQSVLQRHVDGYRDAKADALLEEAQAQSRIRLRDAQVRAHFVDLVRSRVAPATLARSAASTLLDKGHHVTLWGNHWDSLGNHKAVTRGAIPMGPALNRTFNETGVILFPSFRAETLPTAVDALCAGAYIVCRCPDRPFEIEHPGLKELGPHLHFYETMQQLLAMVGTAKRKKADGSLDPSDLARRLVQARHTIRNRLTAMVETMRRRQVEP